MTTKITIQLDDKIIDKAKKISEIKGVSLSNLISDYFKKIDLEALQNDFELTPIVKSLKGSLKGARINENDYKKYLEEKYL